MPVPEMSCLPAENSCPWERWGLQRQHSESGRDKYEESQVPVMTSKNTKPLPHFVMYDLQHISWLDVFISSIY